MCDEAGIIGFVRTNDGRVIHLLRADVPPAPTIDWGDNAPAFEWRDKREALIVTASAGGALGFVLGLALAWFTR